MIRLLSLAGIALAIAGCAQVQPPATAAVEYAMIDPECRNASPGNALPGFRCTGDYTGDATGKR